MLKIGDKVIMTKEGFRFYSNLDCAFRGHSVASNMNEKNFTSCVCELFAVHGVGTIVKFNSCGVPYIRWEHSLDGIKYHYSHYYENEDIKKMNILDKVKFFLKRYL